MKHVFIWGMCILFFTLCVAANTYSTVQREYREERAASALERIDAHASSFAVAGVAGAVTTAEAVERADRALSRSEELSRRLSQFNEELGYIASQLPAPEGYVSERDMPEYGSTAELGEKCPKLYLQGYKLDYDPDIKHFVYSGTKDRAWWIGGGGPGPVYLLMETRYTDGKAERRTPWGEWVAAPEYEVPPPPPAL